LVAVEIDGERMYLNVTRWPATRDGAQLGNVTSAVYSPRLKENIGYAWVPIEHAGVGTNLTITLPNGDERSATVVPKPFVDPKKEIPKS